MTSPLAAVTPLEVWMECKGGRLLQAQILASNTTQRGLAARIGRSRGLIGDLCSGTRRTCSPETAHLICSALGVTLDALFWVESSSQEKRNAAAKLAERKHRVTAPTARRGRARGRAA